MERRRSKRITVDFIAEIILDDKSYTGNISNLSEYGLCLYVKSVSAEDTVNYTPGKALELRFQPTSKEIVNLHCKIKWSYKDSFHGLTKRVGMEIIDPPWNLSNYFLSII